MGVYKYQNLTSNSFLRFKICSDNNLDVKTNLFDFLDFCFLFPLLDETPWCAQVSNSFEAWFCCQTAFMLISVNRASLHHKTQNLLWWCTPWMMNFKISSGGVHHEIQNPLQWWCTVLMLHHEMLKSSPVVYSTNVSPQNVKILSSGLHHETQNLLWWCKVLTWHHKILQSSPVLYTTKHKICFSGVHHKIQNSFRWCKVLGLHHGNV